MKKVGVIVAMLVLGVAVFAAPAGEKKPSDWNESAEIYEILSGAGNDADLPIPLSHCVAYTESRFIPTARSRVVEGYRSCGVMQLYRKYLYGYGGLIARFSSERPHDFRWDDPAQNAEIGCQYLSWLIKKYNGSIWLALVAYNWGPENVRGIHSLDEIPRDVVQYANGILALCDEWKPEWAEGGK